MATTIKIEQLAGEISRMLKDYSSDVVAKVDVSSERIGKAAIKQLKVTSPKKTGKYSRSWRMLTEKKAGVPAQRTVHNTQGQLTHLLEHGHAKVGGGRVKAYPHIRPAEEMVIEEFTKEVEEAIRNG